MTRMRHLRFALPWASLAVALTISALSAIFRVADEREMLWAAMRADGEQQLARLAMLAEDSPRVSLSVLAGQVAQVGTDNSVRLVVVADATGRIVATTDNRLLGQPLDTTLPEVVADPTRGSPGGVLEVEDPGRNLLTMSMTYLAPAMPGPGRTASRGTLAVSYDLTRRLDEALRRALLGTGWNVLLFGVGVAAMALLLSRAVVRPLSGLADATRRLAAGDFGARAPQSGAREIRDLAADFDRMADALERGRRALADSEAQYRILLDTAPDPILVIDTTGQILRANSAVSTLLGSGNAPLEGRPAWSLLAPTDQEAARERFASFLGGPVDQVESGELQVTRVDGTSVPLEVRLARVVTTDGVLLISIGRDASERHRATAELEQARDAAESASRAKSTFLANMSHELRTPMNGVIGIAHLLETTPLDDRQRHYLRLLQSSSATLLRVIEDILDFARIEGGRLSLDTVEVALEDLVADTAGAFTERAESRGLTLDCAIAPDLPARVMGDPVRLTQILNNVLGNAVKFTERGGVRMSVVVRDRSPGIATVSIQVLDTGIGMTADALDRVFDGFHQADASASRRFGGMGLGLAIVRQLVSLMGGRITATSQPGRGSCFTIVLPFRTPGDRPTGPAGAVPVPRPVRCVVVASRPAQQEALAAAPRGWGWNVRTAGTVEEAVAILSEPGADRASPSLCLLAARASGAEDADAASRIRRAAPGDAPRILRIGIPPDDRHRAVAIAAGIDGFIASPVRPGRLAAEAARVLSAAVPASRGHGDPGAATPSRMLPRGLRVLVVEDNDLNRELVVELLREWGVEPDVATDGREAVARVAGTDFDLILMDVALPGMDGLEATRIIRRMPRPGLDRLPILAMTAHALAQDRANSLAAGMNDHLTKPLDPAQVRAALERWCPGARLPDA